MNLRFGQSGKDITLLTDHEKTYESQIYKYKQELMKNEGTTEQTEMDNTENEVPPETRNEVRR